MLECKSVTFGLQSTFLYNLHMYSLNGTIIIHLPKQNRLLLGSQICQLICATTNYFHSTLTSLKMVSKPLLGVYLYLFSQVLISHF